MEMLLRSMQGKIDEGGQEAFRAGYPLLWRGFYGTRVVSWTASGGSARVSRICIEGGITTQTDWTGHNRKSVHIWPTAGHGVHAGKVVWNSVPRIEAKGDKRKMRNLRERPSMMKAVATRKETRIYPRSASKIVVLGSM